MKKEKNKPNREELTELFAEAQKRLESGASLEGEEGVVRPLLKRLLEASLEGEMDAHLQENRPNRRNGKIPKQVKTEFGTVPIETPRDRDGTYEPLLIPKRQRTLGPSLDNKILGLYALGMSYRDIRNHVAEMYGVELSPATLTAITDQIWDEVEAWRTRPLDEIYACVWLDAMYFKVREDGRVVKKAVYMVIARTLEGHKELLGFYIGQSESAKFWMQVLSDLQQRGVQDILICCIDNLSGFVEAIESIYPLTDVQTCIVHQVRNSLKYVVWSDQKSVAKDLRKIYSALDETTALQQLAAFEEKWNKKYPPIAKSWHRHWSQLSTLFNYPQNLRKMIYTTNTIEGFHRQIRKATKTKGAFTSERALIKLLYLAQARITAKWQRAPVEWKSILNTLVIYYEERIEKYLDI